MTDYILYTDLSQKYQVNQHPRRRLLEDINRFCEEAGAIKDVLLDQNNMVWRLGETLKPYTFKTTTPSRIAMYETEGEINNNSLAETDDNWDAFRELISSAQRLAEQTKQSVEIQQEDHGKVILVFTIVTIVFLPLSFVTSLLGMNTVDIRNSDSSQALFWAISLPLTAFVVALSLLVGFKGYQIREMIEKREFGAVFFGWRGK